jgi:hypothetical protein
MRGNDPPISAMEARSLPDTAYSMNQPRRTPRPPIEPAWDTTFTRLTRALSPRIGECASKLDRRFKTIGLKSDIQVRQTPRGLSTFLSVVGGRGLIFIVDMTLIDGMAVGQGPWATLNIRLLDACGDIVAGGLGAGLKGHSFHDISAAQALASESLEQAVTAVYVTALGLFDLRSIARHA